MLDLLYQLWERPLPVLGDATTRLVTFYGYKSALYGTLYRPKALPLFAKITADLLKGDGTTFLSNFRNAITASDQPSDAVLCTDAILLEQRSFGHCSISSVSGCTFGAVLGLLVGREGARNREGV